MTETLIRKDGSNSIANPDGVGINRVAVATLLDEHKKLRAYGFHTGQISSGATLEGVAHALALGMDPDEFSRKLLAMNGISSHFETWRVLGEDRGFFVVSSLATAIELQESQEGRQIRGGMGEALGHSRALLVANYHDEADPREMNIFEKVQAQRGNLLRTESEENDLHAANIALATGATTLMLCTTAEGFLYKGVRLAQIHVEDIDKYLAYLEETRADGNGLGRGGMKTKLEAAREFIAKSTQPVRVVIGSSAEDSRSLLEGDRGTEVVQ